ncbi:MAG: hypothetical protein ABEI58_00315 [Candidatus Nanohaloarchaea archaeon]
MDLGKKVEQYGTLIVGLLIGGGFAFGGIASYAGLVGGGGSGNNVQQQFNASLPQQNFRDGGYGLTSREMRVLAYQNDVVFVTAFYSTSSQRDNLESELSGLPSQMNSRVYVSLMNSTSDTSAANDLVTRFGLTEFPKAAVIGGSAGNSAMAIVDSPSQENVVSAVCGAMRDWKKLSATCIQ